MIPLGVPESEPLHVEIRQLAAQVAAIDHPHVIDSAASIVAWYRRERLAALGLIAVDSMVAPDAPEQAEVVIDEGDPRLQSVCICLRDRLKGLMAWARETGWM
jgi:hypothetical protein